MTNPPTLAERNYTFLKNSSFLGGLPSATLEGLVRRGHVTKFPKGRIIYERGDPGDSLMVILSGRVKISIITIDAKEVVLNFLAEGDVNGEIAALDGGERTATATAIEDTEAFVIYRRDLLPVLTANFEAMLEIVKVLCEKLRAASEMVEDVQREMAGRTAKGLLRLARQHGRYTKEGILIELVISQRELGSYIGLSRESTSRRKRGKIPGRCCFSAIPRWGHFVIRSDHEQIT
jgi:CRP-like cAMP-binding protein